MNTDPIQQIKEEESKSNQKIEELIKKQQIEIEEYQIKKERELEEEKEKLRKQGQEALEKAKQDAMIEFKKIIENENQNRSFLINKAKSRKDEAVKFILNIFEKQLT